MSQFPEISPVLQSELADLEAAFRKSNPRVLAYVLEVPLTGPDEPCVPRIYPLNEVPDPGFRATYEAAHRDALCLWRVCRAW